MLQLINDVIFIKGITSSSKYVIYKELSSELAFNKYKFPSIGW